MTLLSDIHSDPSQAVTPTTADAECPYVPSPDPMITISSPPGNLTLDVPNTDTTPESADTISVTDPTCCPVVTTTLFVRDAECEAKHITAVSETHSDPSQAVCPALALSVNEYGLKPSPAMLTLHSPPNPPLNVQPDDTM